jgi:hypothetical protein
LCVEETELGVRMDSGVQLLTEQAVLEIEDLIHKSIDYGNRVLDGSGDEIDEAIGERYILQACTRSVVLLEQLGLTQGTLISEAKRILESVKADPLKGRSVLGQAYLIWPYEIEEIINTLKSLYLPRLKGTPPEIIPVLDVISNSEYYITDPRVFGKVPDCEAEVHTRIEGLLKCFYTDVQHKPRLSKPIKSFEPDTGIPSLRTLIDYKFITSTEEGKTILDEIFADIGGYQTDDYETFVFVIYETSRLFSSAEWTRAIEASKPQNPIKIVVLRGGSATRKKRTKKQKGKYNK